MEPSAIERERKKTKMTELRMVHAFFSTAINFMGPSCTEARHNYSTGLVKKNYVDVASRNGLFRPIVIKHMHLSLP